MKRLYDAAASVRGLLLCQGGGGGNNQIAATSRRMDPMVREALAASTAPELAAVRLELVQLDDELAHARTNLTRAMEREQFLGVRSRRYRQTLDATARALRDERHQAKNNKNKQAKNDETKQTAEQTTTKDADEDEEMAVSLPTAVPSDKNTPQQQVLESSQSSCSSSWHVRMEQWERDTEALTSIQQTHTTILANIEQMRRTIRSLEQKRAKLPQMMDQCAVFLDEATAATATTTHESPTPTTTPVPNNQNNNNTVEISVVVDVSAAAVPESDSSENHVDVPDRDIENGSTTGIVPEAVVNGKN